MPYSVNWYIENEIIYMHYSGKTTAEELRESLLTMLKMIKESSRQLVHVLTDVGDVTQPISPKDSLDVIREVGTDQKMGWNIVLREQSVIMKIGIAFGSSIFKTRTRAFDTLEEAEIFLAEKDTTINWDQVNKSVIMF